MAVTTDPWQLRYSRGTRTDISMLHDFFVTAQRLRRVLTDGLRGSGMRPDEYAVYSLLFEKGPMTATEMAEALAMPLTTVLDYAREMTEAGHLVRTSHPFDGRATELSLSRAGIAAHRRANRQWEVVRKYIEDGLELPVGQVRKSLAALDDSAGRAALRLRKPAARRRTGLG